MLCSIFYFWIKSCTKKRTKKEVHAQLQTLPSCKFGLCFTLLHQVLIEKDLIWMNAHIDANWVGDHNLIVGYFYHFLYPSYIYRKASNGFLAWGFSLFSPLSVVLIYVLYDLDHQGEQRSNLDCKMLYSAEVLLAAYAMCAFQAGYTACMMVACICKFNQMQKRKKPIESYR